MKFLSAVRWVQTDNGVHRQTNETQPAAGHGFGWKYKITCKSIKTELFNNKASSGTDQRCLFKMISNDLKIF